MMFQTGLSHACANGFMPILELLADVEEVDPNLADNDGNTPLIFAAQAGKYYSPPNVRIKNIVILAVGTIFSA
jgi:ankyrin repeat protein